MGLTGAERSAERSKAAILQAATEEFCAFGLRGARIEDISRRSGVNKRMIYEYFENKEALYVRALELQYRAIRQAERLLELDFDDPLAAMGQLVRFTFDYYRDHPLFVRFIAIENINKGESLAQLNEIAIINSDAVGLVEQILEIGVAKGIFRREVDPTKLYMLISAAGFTYFSNKYTYALGFGENYDDPRSVDIYRAMMVEMILRYLARDEGQAAER